MCIDRGRVRPRRPKDDWSAAIWLAHRPNAAIFKYGKLASFSLCLQLGDILFRSGLFSFSYVNCSLFIRGVLLLIFNLCIGTELYRVEFTEQQLLCWKKLDQFRWVTTMWSPPVCSRSVTTLVLSVFPSQIGITQRCWYRVTVSSFHKTQVFFPFRKDMFFKGNR